MKIVQSWLQQYIAFKIPPEKLADRLTMLGLEFESIERLGEKYNGFVVGEVLECARHPNADKLSVCRVNTGKEVLQIVCGAANVEAGQKVPVGRIGATVPRNQHDPSGKAFTLSQVKIRGVDSFGMICSEYELDLGQDAEGILVLGSSAKVGQAFAAYLGMDDVVYDIEITPNRPDWMSHIGVAREIGVLMGKQPRLPAACGRLVSAQRSSALGAERGRRRSKCPALRVYSKRVKTRSPRPAWRVTLQDPIGLIDSSDPTGGASRITRSCAGCRSPR